MCTIPDPSRPETHRHRLIAVALVALLAPTCWAAGTVAADDPPPAADLPSVDWTTALPAMDTTWQRTLSRAIDPTAYECDPNTPFEAWVGSLVEGVDPVSLELLDQLGVPIWSALATALFDQDATDEYHGVDGAETKELARRHRDARRFWDVPTDDVLLQSMHGAVVADDARMIPVVRFLIGVDEPTAAMLVDLVQQVIADDPGLGFDSPLLTLNAFAVTFADGTPPGIPGPLPDKIVMGDGILQAFEALGAGDVAPTVIHAHEFAHHVNYELGVLLNDSPNPEQTRRTELMADAFAAYNLVHARGATLRQARIELAATVPRDVGDCWYDDPGHHGTPNQREAATRWGAELASTARPQGRILSAAEVLRRFDAALPAIVAPDAP